MVLDINSFLLCLKCFSGKLTSSVNSFGAKGNIVLFANNADSVETARNELSHLKSTLFGFEL